MKIGLVRHRAVLSQYKPPKMPKDVPAENRKSFSESLLSPEHAEMRFKYPEFLPPLNMQHRNKMVETMMRRDMIRRRNVIEIPEFYVGSILAVTISDPYAPGKVSKFVGICIERAGQGTFANFTLRNVVDHVGVEIRYDLYNPTIREIQLLKLEKRLDDDLFYLRDALPEYSAVPFDMNPEPHEPGQPVPVNPIKVQMKPFPWSRRWDIRDLKGIGTLMDVPDWLHLKSIRATNQYEKYDLMKDYREHITEDDQIEIWDQVKQHEEQVTEIRKVERRKKLLLQTEIKPKK